MRTHVNIRIRKKDIELKEFINNLDPTVDVSDAIRTCALYGIRNIGGMFPKKRDIPSNTLNENVIVEPKIEITEKPIKLGGEFFKKKKESQEDDIETLGDNLIKNLLGR